MLQLMNYVEQVQMIPLFILVFPLSMIKLVALWYIIQNELTFI